MKIRPDYSLYLVTDRKMLKTPSLEECVERALEGGMTVVQLREKNCSSKEFYDLGCKLRTLTRKFGVPLIINDRLDIALAVEADGVHLGQSDLDPEVVRRIVGDDMIIGATAHSLAEAEAAQRSGADYIGVGAFRVSPTKPSVNVISPSELALIRERVSLPMVVIGGIDVEATRLLAGRADGIAVSSAIMAATDPTSAAKELLKAWRG